MRAKVACALAFDRSGDLVGLLGSGHFKRAATPQRPSDTAFPMNIPSKPAERQSIVGVRLRKHADYQRAYGSARKRQSASMSWFLAPQPVDASPSIAPRIGLTAGKVLGKAHDRNRIKRRMREVLRRHLDLLPSGCDLIFHPRRSVLTMEFTKLEAEIVRILEQAHAEAARKTLSAETRRISAGPAS
jgi:ribonuclease P protein component